MYHTNSYYRYMIILMFKLRDENHKKALLVNLFTASSSSSTLQPQERPGYSREIKKICQQKWWILYCTLIFWETMEIPKSSHITSVHSYIVDHPFYNFPVSICHEFGSQNHWCRGSHGPIGWTMLSWPIPGTGCLSHPKSGWQVTIKNIHILGKFKEFYTYFTHKACAQCQDLSSQMLSVPDTQPSATGLHDLSHRQWQAMNQLGEAIQNQGFLCHVINMVILRNFRCFFLNISESRNTHHWGRGTNDECLGSPWFPHLRTWTYGRFQKTWVTMVKS